MLVLLAASLILPQTQAQFGTKVSFRQTYLSFSDFCVSMSKQTGMKLAVRKDLEDRKLVIACKSRPAADVLGKFAETFGGNWTEQDGTFKFDLDPSVRDNERIAIDDADQQFRDGLTWFVREIRKIGNQSKDAKYESIKAADQDLRLLKSNHVLESDPRMIEDRAILDCYADASYARIGPILADHEQEVVDTLADGRHVFGIDVPIPYTLPVPQNFFEPAPGDSGPGMLVVFYDSDRRQFDVMEAVGSTLSDYGRWVTLPVSRKALKIERYLTTWGAQNPASLLSKAIQSPSNKHFPSYGIDGLSAADQLVDLSDRSDLPVMGDGFRTQEFNSAWLDGDTIGSWMDQFNRRRMDRQYPAYFRTSGGWISYRSSRYWKHLGEEIPERLLEPLEAKQQSHGLTLDDYTSLAGSIDRTQAKFTAGQLLQFGAYPIQSNYDVLLFIGGLSSEQRAAAERGPVQIGSLSAEQSLPLREALASEATPDTPRLLAALLAPGASGLKATFQLQVGRGEPTDWRLPGLVNAPPFSALSVFQFGTWASPTDGIRISFRVPTAPGD